ncbi:MAG: 50S ribosomal protein L11 methyltransferase [Nitrospirae bacterium]|nr:50S ribosomal protein L11 methyltransferase [Nitrospirota bacterium]
MNPAARPMQDWQDWIEVRIESPVDAGELLGALDDPAVTGAWQEEGVSHLYWPSDRWNPDILLSVKQVLAKLAPQPAAEPVVMVDRLPAQDWNARWAKSVKPIRIGRVVVRPTWASAEEVRLQPGEIELLLDPKQAFGTGHHATTRLLIEWLEDLIHGGERVLDLGTGSGILAMVALRLGAASALGIDYDPVAIDCAIGYAEVNGFGPELDLRVATVQDLPQTRDRPFDLILANLDRKTLLDSMEWFRAPLQRGARLLLSGILAEDRADMAAAFDLVGGIVRAQRECEGWLALEVVAPESCEGHC